MRHLNSIRTWLQSNTDGPVKLSDVSCKENETGISNCNAMMMGDSCYYNQSVWLNCNNSTGDTQLPSTYQFEMNSNLEVINECNNNQFLNFGYSNNSCVVHIDVFPY